MHISEVEDKTAAALAEADLVDDFYHQSIQAAARKLVAGWKGAWEYQTQYGSGATLWTHQENALLIQRDEQKETHEPNLTITITVTIKDIKGICPAMLWTDAQCLEMLHEIESTLEEALIETKGDVLYNAYGPHQCWLDNLDVKSNPSV
jgi:hypothetical protein